MMINLRDLYILLKCAEHTLRIQNVNLGYPRENIVDVVDRVVNSLSKIKLDIKDE